MAGVGWNGYLLIDMIIDMRVEALDEPGAVLIVSCYELGHQPLGLAWPAAFLQRAGFRPACLDTSVEGLDPERIRRARFAAISVPMHTALRLGFQAMRHIRELNPSCLICFFGQYAALNAEYLLANGVDFVIGGEYEEPLVRLLEVLRSGAGQSVAGVGRAGVPAAPYLGRILFPVPRRGALAPLDRYSGLETGGMRIPAGYVEASRGCLHTCLHCPITPIYRGKFFVVPREVVLEDIRGLWASGARHVTFGDPDFLNGPGHSLRIVKAAHGEFPALTFDFTAKIEHLIRHRGLMDEFRRNGCLFIVSAAESLSDTVLAMLEKGHTRADFFEALRIVRGAGIVLRPSLVPFTPWTTMEDYTNLLESVGEAELVDCIDPVQYAIRLLVPPGSALLSRCYMRTALRRFNPQGFTYEWEHPDPRMDRLQADVAALVERAARVSEDAGITFGRIRDLAYETAGTKPSGPLRLPAARSLGSPVRLSEPWFC